jgi:hypothetical protein
VRRGAVVYRAVEDEVVEEQGKRGRFVELEVVRYGGESNCVSFISSI